MWHIYLADLYLHWLPLLFEYHSWVLTQWKCTFDPGVFHGRSMYMSYHSSYSSNHWERFGVQNCQTSHSYQTTNLHIFNVERYVRWGCILNCFMLSSLPCFWSAIPTACYTFNVFYSCYISFVSAVSLNNVFDVIVELESLKSSVSFKMALLLRPLALLSMEMIQCIWIYHKMLHLLAPMLSMWQFHLYHFNVTLSTTMLCLPWEYKCRAPFGQVCIINVFCSICSN